MPTHHDEFIIIIVIKGTLFTPASLYEKWNLMVLPSSLSQLVLLLLIAMQMK